MASELKSGVVGVCRLNYSREIGLDKIDKKYEYEIQQCIKSISKIYPRPTSVRYKLNRNKQDDYKEIEKWKDYDKGQKFINSFINFAKQWKESMKSTLPNYRDTDCWLAHEQGEINPDKWFLTKDSQDGKH